MAKKPTSGSLYRPKYRRPDGTVVESHVWWCKYYKNGVPFRESTHAENWEDGDRFLKRKLGEIVTGRFVGLAPERVRIGELLKTVETDYIEGEKKSLRELKARIKKHLLPAFGEIRAAEFGSVHLRQYVAKRRRQGAANGTVNRELAIISRAFHLAHAADPPLVLRIPHIQKLPENNVREGFMEHSQYQKLLNSLPSHLKPLFVVGYHVGCRRGELRSIRPEQVNLGSKEIRLSGNQTKNARPRTLPIYGDMAVWLQWQLDDLKENWPECLWLFHYRGRRIGSHLKGWATACQAAGLPGLLFHDLRRTAVRNMERAGIPRKVAMAISGHRTESIYRRYDIVSGQDMKLAATKLDAYLKEQTAALKAAEEQAQKSRDGQSDGQSGDGRNRGNHRKLLN
jgi:integrase